MTTPIDSGTGALAAATVMAFSFGGVTLEHFLLGSGCYVVGSSCRFGLKIASAYEVNNRPNWGASIGALSVSPMLATFASMATFFAAHIIGFEGDAAIGLLLALAGFRGSEGIQWIVSIVSRALPDKLTSETKREPKP